MTSIRNRVAAIHAIAESHLYGDDNYIDTGQVIQDLIQICRICDTILEAQSGTEIITEEDIEFIIHVLTAVDPTYPVTKGVEIAERLKTLKGLWDGKGMPISEVDITWEAHEDPSLRQIDTYDIGDLQEACGDWYVKYLHAHMKG